MPTRTYTDVERRFQSTVDQIERLLLRHRCLIKEIDNMWDRREHDTIACRDAMERSALWSKRQDALEAKTYEIALSVGNRYPEITRHEYQLLADRKLRQMEIIQDIKDTCAKYRWWDDDSDRWVKKSNHTDEQIRRLLKVFFNGTIGETAVTNDGTHRGNHRRTPTDDQWDGTV